MSAWFIVSFALGGTFAVLLALEIDRRRYVELLILRLHRRWLTWRYQVDESELEEIEKP